jgi:hypothetical protein
MTWRIFGLVVFGFGLSNAWGAQEYLLKNDPVLPAGIRDSAASVLRLVVLTRVPGRPDFTVPTAYFQQMVGRLGDDGYLSRRLMTDSAAALNAKHPQVPVQVRLVATAFLVGDGDRLLTVMHNFAGSILAANLRNLSGSLRGRDIDGVTRDARTLAEMNVQLQLIDSQGQEVFDTRRPKDVATISVLPNPLSPYSAEGRRLSAEDILNVTTNDILELKLNRRLGAGLAFAKARPAEGGLVYYAGYPPKTKTAKRNADGFSLNFVVGKIQPVGAFIEYTSLDKVLNADGLKDAIRQTEPLFIFADAALDEGMSGGPTLNDRGEIVSLTRGSFWASDYMGLARRPIHDRIPQLMLGLSPEKLLGVRENMRKGWQKMLDALAASKK